MEFNSLKKDMEVKYMGPDFKFTQSSGIDNVQQYISQPQVLHKSPLTIQTDCTQFIQFPQNTYSPQIIHSPQSLHIPQITHIPQTNIHLPGNQLTHLTYRYPPGKKFYYIPTPAQISNNILFKSFEPRRYNELIFKFNEQGQQVPIIIQKEELIPIWIVCTPVEYFKWISMNGFL